MNAGSKMYFRFVFTAFIFFLLALPILILPRKLHIILLHPIFTRLYLIAPRIRVHNLSTVPIESTHPAIYASNHKTFADFCFISYFLRKPYTIMIRSSMFKNVFFRFLAWKMGYIPINRSNPISQINALKRANKMILNQNYSLILFPEGRYHFDKPVGKLRGGISKLARETKVAIIPIAIYGIKNTFIEEKELPWKDVYIKADEAIKFDDYASEKDFIKDLENKITRLYHEIEAEVAEK